MKNKNKLFDENMLISIFLKADDLCKYLEKELINKWLSDGKNICDYKKKSNLFDSEIMTILIFYHYSGFKNFEYYYKQLLENELREYFPKLVSYTRFLELIETVALQMFIFSKSLCQEALKTGIYYIDSKKLVVCHNKRIRQHKVFKDKASSGKSSTGWFYGFKVHLLINEIGEIVDFDLTPGNVADNNQNILKRILKNIKGLCFVDKGYITKLWGEFYEKGLKIVTKTKKTTKAKLIPLRERYLLAKRPIIESVNDIFISVFDLEHSRHRKPENAFTHMIAAICAYAFYPDKPAIYLPNLLKN